MTALYTLLFVVFPTILCILGIVIFVMMAIVSHANYTDKKVCDTVRMQELKMFILSVACILFLIFTILYLPSAVVGRLL